MRRVIPVLILLGLGCSGCAELLLSGYVHDSAISKNFRMKQDMKVVLLPIITNSKTDAAPYLISYFLNAGWRVVDRAQLNVILAEQKFQLSGAVDSNAVEIGKLTGANYVVAGNLVSGEDVSHYLLRLVDVETGEVDANVLCIGSRELGTCVSEELIRLIKSRTPKPRH